MWWIREEEEIPSIYREWVKYLVYQLILSTVYSDQSSIYRSTIECSTHDLTYETVIG